MNNWQAYIGERHSTCPTRLLDKKVAVRVRMGIELAPRTAQLFTWENDSAAGNIVAYRVVEG